MATHTSPSKGDRRAKLAAARREREAAEEREAGEAAEQREAEEQREVTPASTAIPVGTRRAQRAAEKRATEQHAAPAGPVTLDLTPVEQPATRAEQAAPGSVKPRTRRSDRTRVQTLDRPAGPGGSTGPRRRQNRQDRQDRQNRQDRQDRQNSSDPQASPAPQTRRAARAAAARTPSGAEAALRRALNSRRGWGAALAITLVLLVPGAQALRGGPLQIAEGNLPSPLQSQLSDATAAPTAAETAAKARAQATAATARATAAAQAAKRKATAEATKAAKRRAAATSAPTPTSSSGAISNQLSGLPWASGVYVPGSSEAKINAFGAWRGAKVDVVVDWSARSNWAEIVNPTWLYDAWKNTPQTKVFGVAPIPEGDGSTLAACAAGAYNSHWTEFGKNIKAAGLDDQTVIRLGWEFNGNWYKWQAGNPEQFAGCWRQIVGTVEQVAPKLLWDWNVNRGVSSGLADPTRAYPGDAYVNIIGIDSYDQYPGATDEATWAKQYGGPQGLKYWTDFAIAHGKKVSIPEWGLYVTRGSDSGGDNAFYISKMRSFFASLGSRLAYEAYFNESADYFQGSLFGPTQNPAAAARYNALFGS